MAVITSGKTFANGEQLSASKLNQVITAATFNQADAVDGSTMTLIGGAMAVADGGIATAKIADDAVTAAKIAAGALTDVVYPVGSIFTTVNNYANSAAVVNAIGGTTWTAFGAGRVLVGLDASDTDFDTAEETGGAKTVTLTSAQSGVPAHAHKFQITGDSTPDSGTTGGIMVSGTGSTVNGVTGTPTDTAGEQIGGNIAADATSAHNNLQPYIVVYMWKRTA